MDTRWPLSYFAAALSSKSKGGSTVTQELLNVEATDLNASNAGRQSSQDGIMHTVRFSTQLIRNPAHIAESSGRHLAYAISLNGFGPYI
jgi:hypothetical protein